MSREDWKWKRLPRTESRAVRGSAGIFPIGLLALLAGALLFPVVACAGTEESPRVPAVERSTATSGQPRAIQVARFDAPVEVKSAPGFPRMLFVVEQGGRVMIVNRGRKLNRPFIDIGSRISAGGERGLLSIAFPPDYRRSGRFYLYFTDREGDIRIEEFRRSSATRARSSGRPVIEIPHSSYANHNGGQMHFLGRLLYFGTGDGGGGGDPDGNARNLESLLGKLIRIDPRRNGSRPYTVPASNPFVGRAGRDEIYSTGLRNPFRWSFDLRDTKRPRIVLPDVGQSEWEEVNFLPVAAARGADFGWNAFEGRSPFDGFSGTLPTGTRSPQVVLPHPDHCSVIGGVVVRDEGLPGLRGRYLFGDFCRSSLLSTAGRASTGSRVATTPIGVRLVSSISEVSGRRIFVTSLAGGLFRLGQGSGGR